MTDSDYIPATVRSPHCVCVESDCYPRLYDSHAVADSVMHELAQALRDVTDGHIYCDCWRCRHGEPYGPCGWGEKLKQQVEAALARFDARTKGEA